MSTAITASRPQPIAVASDAQHWNAEQIALIKRTVAPDSTDDELKMFLHVAAQAGLDPLQRQVYFIKRRSKKKDRNGEEILRDGKPVWEEKVTIQAGVDGLQARALRMPDCEGIRSATVYAKDEFLIDRKTGEIIKHESNPFTAGEPVGAWAIVEREGKRPFSVIVRMSEYRDTSPMWKNKPGVMIDKVARSTALRRAYPENFGGIYDPAEMGREAMPEPHEEPQAPALPAPPPQVAEAARVLEGTIVDPPPAGARQAPAQDAAKVAAKPPPNPRVLALWSRLTKETGEDKLRGEKPKAKLALEETSRTLFGDPPKPSSEWTDDEITSVEKALFDVPF